MNMCDICQVNVLFFWLVFGWQGESNLLEVLEELADRYHGGLKFVYFGYLKNWIC